MSSVLERLPPQGRIAVIRIRSMGDCVLTTPALSILKKARPDVSIAVAVERRFAELFNSNPDVEVTLPPTLTAVRRWRPDLCVNLHGGGRSAMLTAFSGARWRAGFAHFRWGAVYNVRIPRAQEILGIEGKVHTAEHLASAAFFLGAPRQEIPRARLFRDEHVQTGAPAKPYAVIHPFAATPEKTWRAERFRDVAAYIAKNLDLAPVFIAGEGDDLSAFHGRQTVSGAPLAKIKSLIAGASLFVGNDSGPAHVAAAFGIPVVVIFGSSDPVIWAPWRTQAEVLLGHGRIESVTLQQTLQALERLRVRA